MIDAKRKWNRNLRGLFARCQTVVWGAGSNTHYDRTAGRPLDLSKAALVGVRDYPANHKFVPCASCMLPDFDVQEEVSRDVCVYEHKSVPIQHESLSGLDRMSNGTNDVSGVLAFLRRSGVVVTNTYHGAYWSLLLGKKVILYDKFSSRFDGFPFPLVEFSGDLEADVARCRIYEGFLSHCRRSNTWFGERVGRYLGMPAHPHRTGP